MDVLRNFEDWARIAARLRHLDPHSQHRLLGDYGLAGVWSRAHAHWRDTIIEDIASGRDDRCALYHSLCAEAASAQRPPPASVQPASVQPASVQPASVQPVVTPTPLHARAPVHPNDFRHQLMTKVAENRSPDAPEDVHHDFVAHLSPAGAQVSAPQSDQTSTSGITADSAEAAMAATKALRWPLEKYAEVCARVERDPSHEAEVWATHGVRGKHIARVHARWKKRFSDDPELEEEWRALIQAELSK